MIRWILSTAGANAEDDGGERQPAICADGDYAAHTTKFHDVNVESRIHRLAIFVVNQPKSCSTRSALDAYSRLPSLSHRVSVCLTILPYDEEQRKTMTVLLDRRSHECG